MSETLDFGEKKITLIGTAHVSMQSITDVREAIANLSPDCVAIELDEKRCATLLEPEKYRNLDIIAVLKRKEGFLLLANLMLASFQRRMGSPLGVKPGDEMLAALQEAKAKNIPTVLADRPIATTLKRAWAKNSFFGKIKLLSALLASSFESETISSEQIERLKDKNEMDSMMAELSEYLPSVKEVLINERDFYLASKIWNANGKNIVAVIGAGHKKGVIEHLQKMSRAEENTDTSEIETLPKKSLVSKIAGYTIPALIVALIIAGFAIGGIQAGKKMIGSWIIWNATLAALGALAAFAHPLAILASALVAPLTSLTPIVGVGIFSGIVQALVKRPTVADMENLQADAGHFTHWYKNHVLHVLLVFFFSSLGSSIGTFLGGADIIKMLSQFFGK